MYHSFRLTYHNFPPSFTMLYQNFTIIVLYHFRLGMAWSIWAPLPAGIFAAGHPSQQWPPLGVPKGLLGFPRCPSCRSCEMLRRCVQGTHLNQKKKHRPLNHYKIIYKSVIVLSPKKVGTASTHHYSSTILFFHLLKVVFPFGWVVDNQLINFG